MLDAKGIRSFLKLTLPRISFSKKYFIKRTEPEITIEEIGKLIILSNSHQLLNSSDCEVSNEIKPSNLLIEGEHYSNVISRSLTSQENINENRKNSETTINDLMKDKINVNIQKDYIKVKILFNKTLHISQFNKKNMWNMFDCYQIKRNYTRNTLIIHIHGGGFIAMSPSSHENYLRKWVNALEVPLISIDYRLAPENPYPKALDDVYQAYMWAIKYAEDVLQIKVDKIILAGDSAGGNLVLALNYLLILKNKRQPTALFLAYPGK